MSESGHAGAHGSGGANNLPNGGARSGLGVTVLFCVAVFLGAAMLFLVQPMVGKMVLPKLGGSPAVWNTCMVFFQGALLAGYAYAHGLSRVVRGMNTRKRGWGIVHAPVHLTALALAVVVLPMAIDPAWDPTGGWPAWEVLKVVAVFAGLPFFVVSTTGPLVQDWYARCGLRWSADPYFLYAASNAGSLVGLIGYPLVIEPRLGLGEQSELWAKGYAVYAVLILACVASAIAMSGRARRGGGEGDAAGAGAESAAAAPAGEAPMRAGSPAMRISWKERGYWIALSGVASALLIGVTQHITTDVAAIPLFWVIPLGAYLLTFIVAFSGAKGIAEWARVGAWWATPILAGGLVANAILMVLPLVWAVALHVGFLVCGALMCHATLASRRPAADRLTEYFLLISVGGVVGGGAAALVAPIVFDSLAEYPIAAALVLVLRPGALRPGAPAMRVVARGSAVGARGRRWAGVFGDIAVPAALVAFMLAASTIEMTMVNRGMGLPESAQHVLRWGVPVFVALLTAWNRPVRLGACFAAMLLAAPMILSRNSPVLEQDRTFFAVHKVSRNRGDSFHFLVQGNIVHGKQNMHRRGVPMSYYHPTGPLGSILTALEGTGLTRHVGVIGEGAGAIAAYAGPQTAVTFFEIDPVVDRIARDPRLFTYIADAQARGGRVETVIGDGRLTLAAQPDRSMGVVVLDAFSSDAIPVHLLTLEAMRTYAAKLAGGGVIVVHISNSFADLRPVLAAAGAELGMSGRWWFDTAMTESEFADGKEPSLWFVMSPSPATMEKIARSGGWARAETRLGIDAWTDDKSNLLGVIRWGREAGEDAAQPR